MPGDLLSAARTDARSYVTAGGFQEDINITTPDGLTSLDLTGWNTKHHINFNTDGTLINAKNAHVCIDEQTLTDAGYPVRGVNNEVILLNHVVLAPDTSGNIKRYRVLQNFPDETLGLIVCILGDLSP